MRPLEESDAASREKEKVSITLDRSLVEQIRSLLDHGIGGSWGGVPEALRGTRRGGGNH